MPVRLRITFLFALLVFIILSLVCSAIYYFSYTSRINNIKTRLTNRAITTARLLSQREIFDLKLVQRIDSSTTISLKNKAVQAYDRENRKIYDYSDNPGDTLHLDARILQNARSRSSYYFTWGTKDVVASHYTANGNDMVVISAAEDHDGKQFLKNLLKILVISFLMGLIIVLVTAYFFSRGLLQPIKKITEDVAEISAQNLTRRIQTGHTKDEWYQLSSTLNQLLNRLQESFELQRRFISNASHELSTPLTSISSQLEVSLLRQRDAAEYRTVMESIYQDVHHMGKLTQTLLEFAKASGNPGGLEINLIRLDEVVLRLPAEVIRTNPQYQVTLAFEDLPEEEEKLLVFGNEELLFTAIKNVVVNACKYSDDNRAHVCLQTEDQLLVIRISDKGRGIPKAELEKIFQPFYRVEENRDAGGFGLGLSLADRIIKLHKGSIEVRSHEGKGTEFCIRIPAAREL